MRAGTLLVPWLMLAAGGAAAASLSKPPMDAFAGAGLERGVTRLACERSDLDVVARVRAIVLDVGQSMPQREVLLAPAHVLPRDAASIAEECRIFGVAEQSSTIARFWLSPTGNRRRGADWVVIVTEAAFDEPVRRLQVATLSQQVLEALPAREVPLDVMLMSESADQQDCRILEFLEPRVFAHSCPGWAGLSGAPILLGHEGQPKVIGLQIARTMRRPDRRGALFNGVGFAIDVAVAAAIRQAAAYAEYLREE